MDAQLAEGLGHHQSGRLADAERCYRALLTRQPQHADALHLLGVIAYQVGQVPASIELISRAIAIEPTAGLYFNNLGNALRRAGRIGEAAGAYEKAVELQPDHAEAWGNLGTIRRDQAMFEESILAYERALRLKPGFASARGDLATVLKDQGRVEEAISAYREALRADPTLVGPHSNLIYCLHASDHVAPERLSEEHIAWAKMHASQIKRHDHRNAREPDRRLRIGYVSGDLRDHPVARFIRPLLVERNRESFEITCYSTGTKSDEVTESLRATADAWYDATGATDAQLADGVRQHQIDILVDLGGHTGGGRLLAFARKPAPVQVTYLGYPNTSGLAAMDYRLTDALADPVGQTDAWHTESLIRLDGCFLAYTLVDELPILERDRANRPVTFGSFNNLAKISPTTLKLWTDVLNAMPDARMIIKATSLGDSPTMDRARKRFADAGLPMDRVELLGPARSQSEHLSTYARIDVALDTFPYNGTTTTCEALAMGVPVVSLSGRHHASRVGLSILSAAGFPNWSTPDPKRYVQIACELANQPVMDLRAKLRSSILCDGKRLVRSVEQAYRDAWKRWCNEGGKGQ